MLRFKRLLPALLLFGVVWSVAHDSNSDKTCSDDGTLTITLTCDAEKKQLAWDDPHQHESCQSWSKYTFSSEELSQGADLGVVQTLEQSESESDVRVGAEETTKRLERARAYLHTSHVSQELKDLCRNAHESCTVWSILGECDRNPRYMKKTCAPVCHSCDYLSIEGRCPIDPEAPKAWLRGDLDNLFTKLTNEPFLSEYSVEILSSPSTSGGPWVLTMDNVITEQETNTLMDLGHAEGYKRSGAGRKHRADGSFESNIVDGRTSTNAWCQNACYEDETAQAVIYRLSNLTGIAEKNSEYLQLLKYEPGQYYNIHHDYLTYQEKR
jgi:Rps23 Pro-64 3,4-dihydroxylase Tpa1-like proline 4-hydroxylase